MAFATFTTGYNAVRANHKLKANDRHPVGHKTQNSLEYVSSLSTSIHICSIPQLIHTHTVLPILQSQIYNVTMQGVQKVALALVARMQLSKLCGDIILHVV